MTQLGYKSGTSSLEPAKDSFSARQSLNTCGKHMNIEQISKTLTELIEVVKMVALTEGAHIERESLLIKVKPTGAQRAEEKPSVDIFRGQMVYVPSTVYTIQLTGASDKLDAFIGAIGETQVLEVVRSGVSGIARGEKVLSL